MMNVVAIIAYVIVAIHQLNGGGEVLRGYKTKIAAAMLALLGANEGLHFLPDWCVTMLTYLSAALGMYGLRSAMETKIEQKRRK